MFKNSIRKLKKKLEGFRSRKNKADRAMEEVIRFIDSLEVEALTKEEKAFYDKNLDVTEPIKLGIIQNLALVKGFNASMFQMCTVADFRIVNVMVAKYLNKKGDTAISDILLSNQTSSIVKYVVDDVFEIVKANYMEGLSEDTVPVMKELMRLIKPIVVRACINSRKVVLYNDEANGQEIVFQVKDVVAGLVSIFLEGDR